MSVFTFVSHSLVAEPSLRQKIDYAEEVMRELPQVEVPVRHEFADGLYAREILIPAGTFLTGKVHRFSDMNFVMYGEIDVVTENGPKRVVGPCWFAAKAGAKQIGYAHTDTLWITVHATKNRDLNTLEDELMFPCEWSPHDFASGKLKAQLDYEKAIEELGFTEQEVQEMTLNEDDRTDIELDRLVLKDSPIHGTGVFTICNRRDCETLGMARMDKKRTQLGRYTNHSNDPNCEMVASGDHVYLKTIRAIPAGAELTINYREAVNLARRLK